MEKPDSYKKEINSDRKKNISIVNLYKKQSKLRKFKKMLKKGSSNFENILTVYI
jgi:hypothetical protein